MRLILPALALAALLSACAPTTTIAYTPPPIPPPQQEIIPKPPVTGVPLVWQPGHWDWTGSGYVWQLGEYVPIGNHGNLWMPGYWQQAPSGWQWIPAHWL